MRALFIGVIILGIFGGPGSAMAASGSFSTSFQFGEDNEAPSIPDPVSVIAIAPTQIDVAWGTSTDNLAVAGYQLFRDAVQIATTSQTFFSDTNLIPATLYEYFVVAFDIFGNFSTSSVTVATSTPALPVVDPVSPDRRPASTLTLVERAFVVDPNTNGVRFNWETNLATQFVLRYGTTSELADGTIQTSVYRTNHQTVISGLEADTEYFYELFVVDPFNRGVTLRTGTFRTDAEVG